MKNLEKNLLVQKILEYKRQGYSDNEIAEIVGYTKITISNYLKKCKNLGLITQEEIDKAEEERKFNNFKNNETVQKILKLKKQGYTNSEVAKMLQYTDDNTVFYYIKKIKDMGLITKEEINKAKKERRNDKFKKDKTVQRILELKRQGYSNIEVAEIVGYTKITISNYLEKCKDLGLITQEEIDKAKKERKNELKNNETLQMILELKRQGYLDYEIAKMPNIKYSTDVTISKYVNKLIELGLITQEEIDKAKNERKHDEFINDKTVQRILKLREEGYTNNEIAKIVGHTQNTVLNCIKECKNLGLITQEEIDKAKKEKRNDKFKKDKTVQRILELKRQGYLDYEIAKMSNIKHNSHVTIDKYVKKSIELGLITQEEIDKAKRERKHDEFINDKTVQRILKLREEGYTNNEIAKIVGHTQNTVSNYLEKCKNLGLITQEEIDKAKRERKNELNEDELKNNETLQRLLELKRQGYLDYEIAKMPNIEYSTNRTVSKYVNKLIELGLITQEEIDKAVIERKKERRNDKFKNDEKMQRILELKRQGYSNYKIAKIVGCVQSTISNYMKEYIKLGLITQEEIDKAEEKRRSNNLENNEKAQKILKLKKQGYSDYKIAKIVGCVQVTISNYVKKFIKSGLITQEEIDKAVIERKKERRNDKFKNDEKVQRILELKKQGYTNSEIIKMPNIEYAHATISNYVKEFIELGLITQEEIDKAEEERKFNNFKNNETVQKILKLKKQGYTNSEIIKMPDIKYSTNSTVSKYVNKLIELGLITQEEIDKAVKERKKERKNDEFRNDETVQRILKLKKQGYEDSEVAKMLQYIDDNTIFYYIKKIKNMGLITKEEIKKAKKERRNDKFKNSETVQRILELKRQGYSDNEIAEIVGYTQTTISNYLKKCKNLGLITQEEMDKAGEERKFNDFKNDEIAQSILKLKKEGYTNSEIYKILDKKYSRYFISNCIETIQQLGLISEDEMLVRRIILGYKGKDGFKEKMQIVDEARYQEAIKELMEKINDIRTRLIDEDAIMNRKQVIDKVLGYLVLGYSDEDIKHKLNNQEGYVENIIETLISEKRITQEEIEEYRDKKKEKDKYKILDYLKQGLSEEQIAKEMEVPVSYIEQCVLEIKEKNNISDEEIEKKKAKAEIKRIILNCLKQGMKDQEILSSHKDQLITIKMINDYREELLQEGQITQYEITRYRELRKQFEESKSQEEVVVKPKEQTENNKETVDKNEKELEQKLYRLKSEIEIYVKYDRNIPEEKSNKIREYIDLCNQINRDREISTIELDFLEKAMEKVPIDYTDIVKFAKRCIGINEYSKIFQMIKNTKEMPNLTLSEEEKITLDKLEVILKKYINVKLAENLLRAGNRDIRIIMIKSGLSFEEINFLRMKINEDISKNKTKYCSKEKREKIIGLLSGRKLPSDLKKEYGICDFEMEDIKDQVKYRKILPEKRDTQAQLKQDSDVRMVVLFTKLGWRKEYISKVLKIEIDKIQEILDSALDIGLIEDNQLNGIDILHFQNYALKQIKEL